MLTVSIIIHHNFTYIRDVLNALLQHTTIPITIYVTFNTGNSAEGMSLQSEFPQVRYLVNETPQGFATNHNHVMKLAQTPYVALINDDVKIPPHMVDQIIQYLESDSQAGLVTPRVLNPDGTPQLTSFNDPSLWRMVYKISGLGYLTRQGSMGRNLLVRIGLNRLLKVSSLETITKSQSVPVAVGVAMFVRRHAYEEAGLMDEDTRVYGEEYGWHLRLRKLGWKVVVAGDVSIIHFNSEQELPGWKLAEHRKGILSYFHRYRPEWQANFLRATMIFFHGLRTLLSLPFSRKRAISEWQVVQMAIAKNLKSVSVN